MEIKKVISDKKEFLELLLLADEQESMVDRYLERGDMFVLYDNGPVKGKAFMKSRILLLFLFFNVRDTGNV